jgi:hypothetical protein
MSVLSTWLLRGCSRARTRQSGSCQKRAARYPKRSIHLGAGPPRTYACGKPGCRCHADPPRLHGPYAEWTRKIGGKTVTRRLSPAELTDYQPLFDNAKKLRALLAELQDLTLEIIEADRPQET